MGNISACEALQRLRNEDLYMKTIILSHGCESVTHVTKCQTAECSKPNQALAEWLQKQSDNKESSIATVEQEITKANASATACDNQFIVFNMYKQRTELVK